MVAASHPSAPRLAAIVLSLIAATTCVCAQPPAGTNPAVVGPILPPPLATEVPIAAPGPLAAMLPNEPGGEITSPAALAAAFSGILEDVIPRSYERRKDWGHTKRITVGVRSEGNFFDFDIHRRKKEVPHGVWKHYRIHMINPEKHFDVRMENLRSVEAGKIGFTLLVAAKLDLWAQARAYNRGIHLITLTADGTTKVHLRLDCTVSLATEPGRFLPGFVVQPHVEKARLELIEFRLERVSKLDGPLVRELGDGLEHLIEDELDGPTLSAKLNRSIEKKRDRFKLRPDTLLEWLRAAEAERATAETLQR